MENKRREIAEFYKQIFLDTKLKEKLEKKAKAIGTEEDLKKLIREEIMPLMKKFKVNFSEEELLEYEQETLKELSEESLEDVSGGVSFKSALITGGVLSMALFGGGMLANQNVTSAQVDPPVAQSTSASEVHVETQKKSYASSRKYFNSVKNQVENILDSLGENRTEDEILNFLRGLPDKELQLLSTDVDHVNPQIRVLYEEDNVGRLIPARKSSKNIELYLHGNWFEDFSEPASRLRIIRKLPKLILIIKKERNLVDSESQKKSYEPFEKRFNSAIDQLISISKFLGENYLPDEILNFLRDLPDESLQLLLIDANHLISQIGKVKGGRLYLKGAFFLYSNVRSDWLHRILELPGYISTVENERNQVSINNVTEEGQDIIAAVTQVKGENELAQETEIVSQDEEINNEVESGALNSEENNTAHDEISALEAKDEIGSKETIAQTKEASVTSGTDKKEAHAEEAEVQASVAQAEESAEASEVKDEVENKEAVAPAEEASVTLETEEKSANTKDDTEETKEEDNSQVEDKGRSSEAVEAQSKSEESKNGEQRHATFAANLVKPPQNYAQKVKNKEQNIQGIQKRQQRYKELADYLTSNYPVDEFEYDTKLNDIKFGNLLDNFAKNSVINKGGTYIGKARIADDVAETLFEYAAMKEGPIYFDTTDIEELDYQPYVNRVMKCVVLNNGRAENIINAANAAGINGRQNLKKLLKALIKIDEQGTYDYLPQFMKYMISSLLIEANDLV